MISRDTAARIAYAYDEIKAASDLLAIIEEGAKCGEPPDFRDSFGRRRHDLQLGVPSGETGHRILQLSPKLAAIIIKAHLDNKKREIEALCEVARGELDKAHD